MQDAASDSGENSVEETTRSFSIEAPKGAMADLESCNESDNVPLSSIADNWLRSGYRIQRIALTYLLRDVPTKYMIDAEAYLGVDTESNGLP
ncbi:hypothetical protein QE152_g2019 [Popillia japonica]|uniref:Uncharacterized protein n=1 Tax=Popillia japonica TaxID=7064 RepID=A0AAW1N715_POPJA